MSVQTTCDNYFAPADPAEFRFEEILYQKKDWVATVTINRPQVYNAYSTLTLREMSRAFLDASWDDSVAVLVLTGAGEKAFCTGGDVAEYYRNYTRKPHDYWKWMGEFQQCLDLLRNLGKPVVARLNGVVAGGGNEFNMACDLAVAADHATLLQVGPKVGSVPCGGATQWLPIMIGDRRAREMLYLCERIDAKTALDWGLVNRVVPTAELDQAVAEMCQKLVERFPECIRYTKQQVNFWKDLSWHTTIGHGRDWLALHYTSREPYEGMQAFVDKRPTRIREMREQAARGGSPEFLWGPWTGTCSGCGARGLPAEHRFCGVCGAPVA
ncbi:MAG: enoyl-CoA hydratase/isomerase family protein [Candidatus Eremiobacterota bacterium]